LDFGDIRPVLSGTLGAIVAILVCAAWSRWLPRRMNGKHADTLQFQHRWAIRFANWTFLAGLGAALWMYRWGGYATNDWRPLGLGAGAALSLPLFVLPLAAWSRGCSAAEAYVAFALNQKTPLWVLYPLLLLGLPLFAFSIASL
jgi:hypothetical protein